MERFSPVLLVFTTIVLMLIPTSVTYTSNNVYIDPPLNPSYPLKELGRYTDFISSYLISLDIDHDGEDEIAFLSTETLYRLYIIGENGVEYEIDTQPIVNGIHETYLAEDNDTLYILFTAGAPGILVPKIIKIFYNNSGSYTYDLDIATPIPGVGPFGPVPLNPLRAIVVGHRYLVATINVSPDIGEVRHALLIIDLNTLESYLYPWNSAVSIFFTPSYLAINGSYYIFSSSEVIVINSSINKTIALPANYSYKEVLSIVALEKDVGRLVFSYIYGEYVSYQNNSIKYIYKIDVFILNTSNSSVEFVGTWELLSYIDHSYPNSVPYGFVGAIGYRRHMYIVFNNVRTNRSIVFIYNIDTSEFKEIDLPLMSSYVTAITKDATLYLYIFGSTTGYYILDPVHSLFKYVRLNISIPDNSEMYIEYAILADINGDQLYELIFLLRNITSVNTCIYALSISPPEGLLPLNEVPLTACIIAFTILMYIAKKV